MAAGVVVSKAGTSPVTRKEFEAFYPAESGGNSRDAVRRVRHKGSYAFKSGLSGKVYLPRYR